MPFIGNCGELCPTNPDRGVGHGRGLLVPVAHCVRRFRTGRRPDERCLLFPSALGPSGSFAEFWGLRFIQPQDDGC